MIRKLTHTRNKLHLLTLRVVVSAKLIQFEVKKAAHFEIQFWVLVVTLTHTPSLGVSERYKYK